MRCRRLKVAVSQITAYGSWHNSRHWIVFETTPLERERLFSAGQITTTLVALGPRHDAGGRVFPTRLNVPVRTGRPGGACHRHVGMKRRDRSRDGGRGRARAWRSAAAAVAAWGTSISLTAGQPAAGSREPTACI